MEISQFCNIYPIKALTSGYFSKYFILFLRWIVKAKIQKYNCDQNNQKWINSGKKLDDKCLNTKWNIWISMALELWNITRYFQTRQELKWFCLGHVRHLHTVTNNFSIKTCFSSSLFLGQHWVATLYGPPVSGRVSDCRPESVYLCPLQTAEVVSPTLLIVFLHHSLFLIQSLIHRFKLHLYSLPWDEGFCQMRDGLLSPAVRNRTGTIGGIGVQSTVI